jgi:glyoxylase-like metal-dependent hydrolase (beta-lactamase superfamily II)/rhodanese-related sulfurtransferase
VHFRQFYVGCLAHASYLIGDEGEAVVVDPSRDVQMYLDEAATHGLRITTVLETHLHADFVSGHRDLQVKTGATIGIGARAKAGFPHLPLQEGDVLAVGRVRIRVLETPGHTPESLSFLVYEKEGDAAPWGVLTGDTLFVGDVGRVDILSSRLPVEDLAGMMYDSLHGKLLPLPDDTRVYPAHGAGSLCGRSIGRETWSTIGKERTMNPALAPMSRAAFVRDITQDVPETPAYFLHSRDTNRAGPPILASQPMAPLLAPADFARTAERTEAVVLDTRTAAAFGNAHIPGSLHVGLDGQFASWVGTLVQPSEAVLIVAEPERAEEAVVRLTRVGYENVLGVLDGGITRWMEENRPIDSVRQATVEEAFATKGQVLDVRREREWEATHIDRAVHIPLAELPTRLGELDPAIPWTVVCAGGYRSSIASSVLKRAGIRNVTNAVGGIDAWFKAGGDTSGRKART